MNRSWPTSFYPIEDLELKNRHDDSSYRPPNSQGGQNFSAPPHQIMNFTTFLLLQLARLTDKGTIHTSGTKKPDLGSQDSK